MANQAANRAKYLAAQGGIDFSSDVFKIILMDDSFVFNKDTHHQYSDVSAHELGTGFGYTAGGYTLLGVTVTENDVDDRTDVTWNNPTWAAAGGSIGPSSGAIIYDDTDANDSLIGYIDFLADYTQVDGGSVTLINVGVRVK